jgi:short-subunit dehydrogenase
MNILVIGPGQTSGKFGKDFCELARNDGHDVFTISHGYSKKVEPTQIFADFNDIESMNNAFDTLTKEFVHLDMMLYNSNYSGSFPNDETQMFNETSMVPTTAYLESLQIQVICPHFFAIKALSKMTNGDRIVFMTTGLTYARFDENVYTARYAHHVGYIGSKSYQNALMMGLAENNQKSVIVASIAPHFPYEDPAKYNIVLGQTYRRIMKITDADNANVIKFNNNRDRINF